LLSAKEAATYLGLSEAYLAKLRSEGGGPDYVKIGTRVLYSVDFLAAFIAARRRTSTADTGKAA
jgi:hypothetical protein